jgi:hypothetical protein
MRDFKFRKIKMKKIINMNGRMIKRLLIVCALTLYSSLSFAAKVTVSAPNIVTIGEKFQISITVDVMGEDIRLAVPPVLSDFQVIAGPVLSSRQVSINGQTTAQTTFTYYVQAVKEGTFGIGQPEVKVGNTSLKADKIAIEVIKESQKQGAQTPPNQQQGQGGQTQQNTPSQGAQPGIDEGDLFIRVELSRGSLYRGESLVASIVLYTRVALTGLSDFKVPQLTGFYSQDIDVPANENNLHRVNYNGKVYNSAVLKRYVLFPQRSGNIRVEPVETAVSVQVPRTSRSRSMFDDFFAMPYETVEKRIKSAPVTVNVKDLPAGAPASFKGAVGNFTMKAATDRTETTANQAISYSLTVSGTGNLKLVEVPTINFPADFDKYEPKVTENIRTTLQGSTGSKKFEYALIPRSAGTFEIPETEFTYFDTNKGTYVTLKTNSISLAIEKDPHGSNAPASTSVAPGVNQQDIRYLGNDIVFIKTAPLVLQPRDYVFFGSTNFWLWCAAILAAFVLICFVLRKREKNMKDLASMRNKKAVKIAKQRLKKSAALLKAGDKNGFYDEVARAVWGYLGDKLNIPVAYLSRDNVQEKLTDRGVNQENIDLLLKAIDDCEYARYAPGSEQKNMEHVYDEAIQAISKLESGK